MAPSSPRCFRFAMALSLDHLPSMGTTPSSFHIAVAVVAVGGGGDGGEDACLPVLPVFPSIGTPSGFDWNSIRVCFGIQPKAKSAFVVTGGSDRTAADLRRRGSGRVRTMRRGTGKKTKQEEAWKAYRSRLDPRAVACDGLPREARVVVHHPTQRLLLVGDVHGRIHVHGAPGASFTCEAMKHVGVEDIKCACHASWIVGLLRDGSIACWRLDQGVHPLLPGETSEHEPVRNTAVAVVDGADVVWTGGEDGAVRAMHVGRDQVDVLSYCMRLDKTVGEAAGWDPDTKDIAILALLPQPRAERRRLLVVAPEGIALCDVWDKKAVAAADRCVQAESTRTQGDKESSRKGNVQDDHVMLEDDPVTCCCWMGLKGAGFATGHTSGDIRIWKLPEVAHPVPLQSCPPTPYAIQCIATLHTVVLGRREKRSHVRNIWYSGGPAEALIVLGGGADGFPDVLSRIPLDQMDLGKSSAVQNLPWMGPIVSACLVYPPSHAREGEASHAVVLTDEGHIYLHSQINAEEPSPADRFCPISQQWDMTCLVQIDASRGKMASESFYKGTSTIPQRHRSHPFNGGTKGKPNFRRAPTLLISGHFDGQARVWDCRTSQLALLHTLTHPLHTETDSVSSTPGQVTKISACSSSGLCAVGYSSGDVCLFHWSGRETRQTKVQLMKEPGVTCPSTSSDAKGFRCIARTTNHSAPISCLELSSTLGCLAIGDASGKVSVVNVRQCEIMWQAKPCQQRVCGLCFCKPPMQGLDGILVVLSADSTATAMNLADGSSLGSPLVPKSTSTGVGAHLIDERGRACMLSGEYLALPWLGRDEESNLGQGRTQAKLTQASGGSMKDGSSSKSPEYDGPSAMKDGGLAAGDEIIGEGQATASVLALMDYYKEQPTDGDGEGYISEHASTSSEEQASEEEDASSANTGVHSARQTRNAEPVFGVVATEEHIRVYPMKNLLTGDRGTVSKVRAPSKLAFVAPFEVPEEDPQSRKTSELPLDTRGCLLALTKSQEIIVYTLPDLDIVLQRPLANCVDWEPYKDNQSCHIQDFSCVSTLGDAALLREGGEVIRLSMLSDYDGIFDFDVPQVYDYIVEEAANMANLAVRDEQVALQQRLADPSRAQSKEEGKKRLGVNEFFSKAARTVADGALDVGQKVGGFGADVGSLLKIAKKKGQKEVVFEPKEIAHPSEEELLVYLGSQEEADSLDLSGWTSILTDSEGIPEDPIHLGSGTAHEKNASSAKKEGRQNLLGFANPSTSTKAQLSPQMRSASEIRRKYGYGDEKAKAGLEETRQKLAERGERLEQMSRKAADMEDGARGFASLAKQLAEGETNKKWWQI